MASGPNGFDLSAAWLRRAQGDARAFLDAFATRMEGALPGLVQVDRRRAGLLSRESHVVRVVMEVDGATYTLELEHGRLLTRRSKAVRGITLKSETMAAPEWLAALDQDIARLAGSADAASSVIHDFLMS